MIYPKPYSIYLRRTISLQILGSGPSYSSKSSLGSTQAGCFNSDSTHSWIVLGSTFVERKMECSEGSAHSWRVLDDIVVKPEYELVSFGHSILMHGSPGTPMQTPTYYDPFSWAPPPKGTLNPNP